ncbi:hypothetical protein BDN72DRAFT_115541 [Pluteus cervinus]|uniref:Uncharacterized protein n=1 Tax=Pluteus cervinus TaxID=181527 RepID=A0ACD3ANI6_9AGAR|nr:hypothetical protein BDN72DRAFT_115541 [Pluteus cervinus]
MPSQAKCLSASSPTSPSPSTPGSFGSQSMSFEGYRGSLGVRRPGSICHSTEHFKFIALHLPRGSSRFNESNSLPAFSSLERRLMQMHATSKPYSQRPVRDSDSFAYRILFTNALPAPSIPPRRTRCWRFCPASIKRFDTDDLTHASGSRERSVVQKI